MTKRGVDTEANRKQHNSSQLGSTNRFIDQQGWLTFPKSGSWSLA